MMVGKMIELLIGKACSLVCSHSSLNRVFRQVWYVVLWSTALRLEGRKDVERVGTCAYTDG